MTKYDAMILLNNVVFTTEDVRDKVDELTGHYGYIDCADVEIDPANDDDETISIILMGY